MLLFNLFPVSFIFGKNLNAIFQRSEFKIFSIFVNNIL
jgi:hypothetical protein